jgi:2-C-methyl-D-erythritol 2,4-cyclodiphosphate synthase
MFRIGFSEDIHPFKEGRKLFLGGLEIKGEVGLDGHSDADVVLHALAEAILGAMTYDDLGTLFPDTDPKYKGISSIKLLKHVVELTNSKGYKVGNLDCMIHCERPKLSPHKALMAKNIAEVLGISNDRVSIKAGTNEKMDSVGEGRSIECDAVVLMIKE